MKSNVNRRLTALEDHLAAIRPLGKVPMFMQQGVGGPFEYEGRIFPTEEEASAAYPDAELRIFFEVVDCRRKHNENDEANQ